MRHTILPAFVLLNMWVTAQTPVWNTPQAGNPVIGGYFADPSIVVHEGTFYLYATIDPWGTGELALWSSRDFADWTMHRLNWPTKQACTSSTSHRSMVWAPAVVRGPDGRFYMYISVGSEIWAGVAEHPTGPWKNALADNQPLIRCQREALNVHTIDADCFIDDDGRIYLYWGSGWNYVNGRCLVAELEPDMITFKGEFKDITPTGYFEGPHMVKRGGRYYLTYSEGVVTQDSYEVRYAISDSPLGPFVQGKNSPILTTDKSVAVRGPGHHWILRHDRQDYIVYHRHSNPYDNKVLRRQICIDRLDYDEDGAMLKVRPTHEGIGPLLKTQARPNLAFGKPVTASSFAEPFRPEWAIDENYGTRWQAQPSQWPAWIEIDLQELIEITECRIEFEYPYLPYTCRVDVSSNRTEWTPLGDQPDEPRVSPHHYVKSTQARYVRVTVSQTEGNPHPPAIWEVRVYH